MRNKRMKTYLHDNDNGWKDEELKNENLYANVQTGWNDEDQKYENLHDNELTGWKDE